MKKLVVACALTSMIALSATANASEFTINPLVGASHSKASGTNLALGLEAGYSDFIFGYTYTGDKNETSSNYAFFDTEIHDSALNINTYDNDKFKAHSLYVGYQFDLGAGHLAVKAGVELSKYSRSMGVNLSEINQGGNAGHKAGLGITGTSNYEYSPMVGVGYYMNSGLNFNLHYTFQDGKRDMNISAHGYNDNESKSEAITRAKKAVSNRDFGAVMFTVGYRF
ncbi:outer membrane beta-barrel protein [Shewanella psychrophila]|nr:outer membrane beta-barrel protein [Shewanella psychrophila]